MAYLCSIIGPDFTAFRTNLLNKESSNNDTIMFIEFPESVSKLLLLEPQ